MIERLDLRSVGLFRGLGRFDGIGRRGDVIATRVDIGRSSLGRLRLSRRLVSGLRLGRLGGLDRSGISDGGLS